jgi:hypothetical protein
MANPSTHTFRRWQATTTALATVVAMLWGPSPAQAQASQAEKLITRHVHPGQEILIRGFAEFDRSCRRVHVPEIRFIDYPRQGVASSRAGEVTVGPNWVGEAQCVGTVLDGVLVRYKAKADFVGQDHFSFDVVYARFKTVRANVDVTVE